MKKLRKKTEPVDHTKGEYHDSTGIIRICPACAWPKRYKRHTCGLKELQDMFRIG